MKVGFIGDWNNLYKYYSILNLAIADCEWMFEETRNYINTRKAFGRTLSGLQTIQHKMAEMKTSIAVCRAFMDQCIELLDKK